MINIKKLKKRIKRKYRLYKIKKSAKLLKKSLLNSTILGFGFNRLPYSENEEGKKVPDYEAIRAIVDTYMSGGCRYFEVGYNYMRYQSERIAKTCLVNRYPRDEYLLCDKLPVRNRVVQKNSYQEIFNRQLKRCGVKFFDIYLLHNVNRSWYEKKGGEAFEFLNSVKQKGKAKLIGFSFHDKADTLEQILTNHPEIDIVQLQINYQDWESDVIQSKKCYEVAIKHNKIITVMEPLKGGNLINRLPKEAEKIISDAGWTPAEFGLKFVFSKEKISVVLSGMGAVSHVQDNICIANSERKFEDKDDEIAKQVLNCILKEREIDCTNCGYCLDVCPKNIPINSIFQLINNETQEGKIINRNAKIFYRGAVSGQGKSSDCVRCAKCENVCSQLLPICDYLENAKMMFE